jgi:predicted nucleic acid-binding Zn ribbon protein
VPPRPKRRRAVAPTQIAAALWAVVRQHVHGDTIRLLHVQDVWARVAGPQLAARTWPTAVHGDTLIVHVHDSQWLHELTYMRQDLLQRLDVLLPGAAPKLLKLRLGEVLPVAQRPVPESPPPPPKLAPPRFSPEPDAGTRAALDAVADPELKQILAGARVMLGRP